MRKPKLSDKRQTSLRWLFIMSKLKSLLHCVEIFHIMMKTRMKTPEILWCMRKRVACVCCIVLSALCLFGVLGRNICVASKEAIAEAAWQNLREERENEYYTTEEGKKLRQLLKPTPEDLTRRPAKGLSQSERSRLEEISKLLGKVGEIETPEWRMGWINRYLEFAEAHSGTQAALKSLKRAVISANSMGDRVLAAELKGRIVEGSVSQIEKGKWALSQAASFQKLYWETKDEAHYKATLAKIDEAIAYWESADNTDETEDKLYKPVEENILNAKYEKGKHLWGKENPEYRREALVLFKEVLTGFDSIASHEGFLKKIKRRSLLWYIFELSCELKDRESADLALEKMRPPEDRGGPLSYYAERYADAFFGNDDRAKVDYRVKWFEQNADTERAWYVLYHAAVDLFYGNHKEEAYSLYKRLLEDHRLEMEKHESESETREEGNAEYFGEVIYRMGIMEKHRRNYEASIEYLKEFIERYPKDDQVSSAEFSIKYIQDRLAIFKID